MGTFISTKGRYAIRLLIDLAEHADGERIPLKDVAERQCISLKYLETFMPSLVKAGLVSGSHGKGGGYALLRSPSDIMIGTVLRVTEGSIATVACLERQPHHRIPRQRVPAGPHRRDLGQPAGMSV